uniref:Uncharacterized protein n=1 Tax=Arundo donax TaxID=35708 RepID=A0A0A9C094_ARUDO
MISVSDILKIPSFIPHRDEFCEEVFTDVIIINSPLLLTQ